MRDGETITSGASGKVFEVMYTGDEKFKPLVMRFKATDLQDAQAVVARLFEIHMLPLGATWASVKGVEE